MTEQLKAEAYVRSQRPDLIERGLGAKNFVLRDGTKVPILNNINLHDWLAVLGQDICKTTDFNFRVRDGQVHIPLFRYCDITGKPITLGDLHFNLTTGQPATEGDYKIFNDITGV